MDYNDLAYEQYMSDKTKRVATELDVDFLEQLMKELTEFVGEMRKADIEERKNADRNDWIRTIASMVIGFFLGVLGSYMVSYLHI